MGRCTVTEEIRSLEGQLREHPFVRGATHAVIAKLASLARVATFPAGSFVLREGDEADTLYLITHGRVVLEVHVPGHGSTKVETVEGGDILGLHWLVPPRRWVLDARTTAEVHALAIHAPSLRTAMEDDPVFGYAVSERLLEHLYDRLARSRLQRLDVYKTGA